MMFAHRIQTTLSEDGTLHLQALPFTKGDVVEVIILKKESGKAEPKKQRTVGEYRGKIRLSDDFSQPLPEQFWVGEE
jgi:hypothetical protein